MFGGQQQQQQQQQQQNVPSDPSLYQNNFERMHCDNYLCPDTLGKFDSVQFNPLHTSPVRTQKEERDTHRETGREEKRDYAHIQSTTENQTDQSNPFSKIKTACVHFPHHCPCPWPQTEDKFEMGEGGEAGGHRICVSKGGFKVGEAARKVELARKGML